MGRVRDGIDDDVRRFVEAQPLFFVATAPRRGRINVSPKGLDGTFRILDEGTVAYLDLTGSGAETVAHLRDDGRITFLFCAFEDPPRLVRLHGRGEAVLPGDPRWAELRAGFPDLPGVRAIVVAEIDRVADSCGFGVPRMRFEGQRDHLPRWTRARGDEEALARYRRRRNAVSIDGLPAFDEPPSPRLYGS